MQLHQTMEMVFAFILKMFQNRSYHDCNCDRLQCDFVHSYL